MRRFIGVSGSLSICINLFQFDGMVKDYDVRVLLCYGRYMLLRYVCILYNHCFEAILFFVSNIPSYLMFYYTRRAYIIWNFHLVNKKGGDMSVCISILLWNLYHSEVGSEFFFKLSF